MQVPNPHIFKEYDIRGVVETDLPEHVAEAIGKAFGTYVARKTGKSMPEIVLGRDVRLSSPALAQSVTKGLLSAGARVISIGVCPTPATYFSLFHLAVDGGIMITGSHNPSEYNGFKLCYDRTTIFGNEIKLIAKMIAEDDFQVGSGEQTAYPILEAYHNFLVKRHFLVSRAVRPLKVVVDAGNATSALIVPSVLRDLGCEVEELFCTIDGSFPNHHPDPTIPANLEALIRKVRECKADIGFAFDGDADRLGVVDETGRILWGDEIMVILAKDILKRHPGAAIIGEVKCSQRMYDAIEKAGGKAIMWKTGHSLIKNKMKEEKALLAGEMSGHLFLAEEYFGYDDAIHACLEICRILVDHFKAGGKGISELIGDLPPVCATPEIRIECSDEHKNLIVAKISEVLLKHQKAGHKPLIKELITIDGVRAVFEDGWGLVRASNTQPILVSRFEALSENLLLSYKQFMEKIIAELRQEIESKKSKSS